MDFFQSEKLSKYTTKITILNNVTCYLVEGTESAVLLDSGMGVGNLKAYVESLTDKPVSVILTHGHVDHAGGAAPFEKVYLHEADWELANRQELLEIKMLYLEKILKDRVKELKETDISSFRTNAYLPLMDGQIFKLGEITLEILAVPGHTRGTVCVLNREERWIMFGDACSPCVFLWAEESTSVEEYLESIKRLKKYEDCYDTVLLSHGAPIIDKKVLDGVIEACEIVLDGTDDKIPYHFLKFTDLKVAKKANHQWVREDGGLGNIVYNPSKIFR